MTVVTLDPDVLDTWAQHPLVKRAGERADSTLGLLENLQGVLTEFEERCPGARVRDVFGAGVTGEASPWRLLHDMHNAGAPADEILTLLDLQHEVWQNPPADPTDNVAMRSATSLWDALKVPEAIVRWGSDIDLLMENCGLKSKEAARIHWYWLMWIPQDEIPTDYRNYKHLLKQRAEKLPRFEQIVGLRVNRRLTEAQIAEKVGCTLADVKTAWLLFKADVIKTLELV